MKNHERILDERSISRTQVNLLAMAEGFFESSILFALNKLRVFSTLGKEEKTLEQIAATLNAQPATISRLLNAGVAIKLLESRDGTSYRLKPAWWPVLLETAGESYLGNWLSLLEYLSASLTDLDKAAAHGGPTIDYLATKNDRDVRDFTLAMHNYASLRGKELAHFLDTSGCETLLDLGAGPGTHAFQLGSANPGLELFLMDLPEVLAIAKEVEGRYDLECSVNYLPVDVTREEITGTYDIVLVSNMLHMLGEVESRKLIKRLFNVVKPGGSLVVQFQYLNENRLGGRWPIMLDLAQLCVTENGRNHTVGETTDWLENAGYTDIEFNAMTLLNANGFLRGYRP